jgi:hypothetical protein
MLRASQAPAETLAFEHQPSTAGLVLSHKPPYLWAIFPDRGGGFDARVHPVAAADGRANRNTLAAPPKKKRAGLCARRRFVADQIGGPSMRHGHHGLQRVQPNAKGRIVLADAARRSDAAVLKANRARLSSCVYVNPDAVASLMAMAISMYGSGGKYLLSEGVDTVGAGGSTCCSRRGAPAARRNAGSQ